MCIKKLNLKIRFSELPPTELRATAVCLSDLHFAPSSQDWERSVSVRPPLKLCLLARALLVPGDGSASRAPGFEAGCGRLSLRFCTASFTPRRHAGWRGFSAHLRGRTGQAENCRASGWLAWNPSPPAPAPALWWDWGARRRCWGVFEHRD